MFSALGLSAARADMDIYKEIAISRFKELKEVSLAIAAGVKQGFENDGSTSATVVEANCIPGLQAYVAGYPSPLERRIPVGIPRLPS
jgi:hypothetical protein